MSQSRTILPRPSRGLLLLVVALLAPLLVGWLAKGRGLRTAITSILTAEPQDHALKIVASDPLDGAFEVPVDALMTAELRLRRGQIDSASINCSSVMLIRTATQTQVPATVKLARNGVIQLRPDAPLEPATNYTFCITADVRHQNGSPAVPWASSFTTVNRANPSIEFEKVGLPNATGAGFTCVQVAPNEKLWASTDDGRFFVFPIEPDGMLGRPVIIKNLQKNAGEPRLITGFCFDPASTPHHPVIWVCHNAFKFNNAPDFTGKVTVMAGPDLEDVDDAIVNLPRSVRDHMTNQPIIGPDGALYFPQGSSSSYGAPDELWGMRNERLLTATILRLDRRKRTRGQTIDARTHDAGGTYDPYSLAAPLTIYATGIRNAYDLCWHSNGHLYVPVNGSSAGGHTPASAAAPPLRDISTAEDDWLVRIAPGMYHGHPNPTHDRYVLNGGNPNPRYDVAETFQYPVGTRPEADYVPPIYSFGKHTSANGIVEYQGNAFGGRLKRRLLICRYNLGGDIIALALDATGNVASDRFGIRGLSDLVNPLDIAEDTRSGNLYISEYGAMRISLFRPME